MLVATSVGAVTYAGSAKCGNVVSVVAKGSEKVKYKSTSCVADGSLKLGNSQTIFILDWNGISNRRRCFLY